MSIPVALFYWLAGIHGNVKFFLKILLVSNFSLLQEDVHLINFVYHKKVQLSCSYFLTSYYLPQTK